MGKLAAQSESVSPYWSKAIGGVVLGTPSVQAGSVVVAVDGGAVKAYSWQGKLLWEFFAQGKLQPFITRSWNGVSYVCRTNGTLIAINRVGRELWRMALQTPLSTAIVCGWDGRLFVPEERRLSCYNDAGRLLWSKDFESAFAIPPLPDKRGGLLMVLDSGALLQIDAFGGVRQQQLIAVPLAVVPLEPPPDAADADKRAIRDPLLVLYQDGGAEVCGAVPLAFPWLPAAPLAASEYRGTVALALANGQLALFSAQGEALLSVETGVSGEAVLINDERGIYVLNKSRVEAFYPNGLEKWTIDIQYAVNVPVLSREGVLYSGGSDWILYAYQVEDSGAEWGGSLYGMAPKGVYGLGELPAQLADYYNRFNDSEVSRQFAIIREKILKGQVGEEEPALTRYLKEVAGSMRYSLSAPATQPPLHLRRRIEAVQLLAALGSEELIPFFADLVRGDKEPLVKVAATEAIGRIGVDPEGLALKAFSEIIGTVKDEQVLAAIAIAIGELCQSSGPPLSAVGIPLLVMLAAKTAPPAARKNALQALKALQR
jgi:outer membrane protein assembly factor BamB